MKSSHIVFTGENYTEHFDYWNDQWSSALKIPFLIKGNVLASNESRRFVSNLKLPEDQSKLIKDYANNGALESFILFLTGIFILIDKYQPSEYLVIDTPLNNNINKNHQGWQKNIPLCYKTNEEASIKEVIEGIGNVITSAYKYQNFPFDILPNVEEHQISSNVLVYNIDIHQPPTNEQLEQYDLIVHVKNAIDKQVFEYTIIANNGVFSEWFIDNLSTHFQQVISSFKNLEEKVKNVSIFSTEEFKKITESFNGSYFDYPKNATVVDLFENQVTCTPDRTAIIYRDRKLSYSQLNEQSNLLANGLIYEYDIVPGTFIGVMMDKSEDIIISLLAIFKAKAIYVPIDPLTPKERLHHIFDDAGVKLLITHSGFMFKVESFSFELLVLDIQLELMSYPLKNLEERPAANDLAYLIYTSGSTGKPKGVLIEHSGLVNVSLFHVDELCMAKTDVYLQFMSLAFDGSLLDIFTALLSGAALLIPDKDIINNTPLFLEYINVNNASVLTLTPSYLSTLNKNRMLSVRTLISAGEAAIADDAYFYASFKNFYNGYGPSETTINSTLYKLDKTIKSNNIPIGKPSANKKVFILNEQWQIAPIGIVGEIFIAGEGMAKGYLNDGRLTAEKFVEHPFIIGQKLYRSGDLGRWLPDGNIQYIGRKDYQVKLNGFRVDLGEIENALLCVDHIKHSSVIIHEKDDRQTELIAFYQPIKRIEVVPSLGEYFIYDPFLYKSMAKDKMRVEGYKSALKNVVKDKIVLDPGTGKDMILARHCIEAGATKVYAVERDEYAYAEAKEILIKHHLQDRIILVKADIRELMLPEKIDYVVSALAGNISSSDGCIPFINSLKKQLPYDLHYIPSRYLTKIAATCLPFDDYNTGFNEISAHYIFKVFDKYNYKFDLRLCLRHFSKEYLISDHGTCEVLDYRKDLKTEGITSIKLTVHVNSKFHGLVLWINAFDENESLMIDSLEETHHLPVYFPISQEGIDLEKGDVISFSFERKLSDNELNPDYFVRGTIVGKNENMDFAYDSYNHRKRSENLGFYSQFFDDNKNPIVHKSFTEKSLKQLLGRWLPNYMIPSRVLEVPYFPVTENKKIDKNILLKQFLELDNDDGPKDLPRNDLEKLLVEIVKSVLVKEHIGINDDFFKMGGDSIKAIQIASRMHGMGYKVQVKDLFANPVIADLAENIKPLTKLAYQGEITGNIPFTPIQHELFPIDLTEPYHYNQAVMFYHSKRLNLAHVEGIFNKIYEHHDILRATFKIVDRQWEQYNQAIHPLSLKEIDLTSCETPLDALNNEINVLQTSINLENGPLLKVGLFRLPDGDRLLIIAHHLVIDTVSWRILFEDIETLFQHHDNVSNYKLPSKTSSFKAWAEQLVVYANSNDFLKERKFWMQLELSEVRPIKKNNANSEKKEFNTLEITLDENKTKKLLYVSGTIFKANINEILLTAIGMAMKKTFGNDKVLIALESHGRENIMKDIDVSRTVGWFTTTYPFIVEILDKKESVFHLNRTKESLRKVPQTGIGHGILKHLTSNANKKEMLFNLKPQISFNYLGQFDEDINNISLQIAHESTGKMKSDHHKGLHDIEISGLISAHKLTLTFAYNSFDFATQKMKDVVRCCKNAIEELIEAGIQEKTDLGDDNFEYSELSVNGLEELFD